jgi:hypothetical protein
VHSKPTFLRKLSPNYTATHSVDSGVYINVEPRVKFRREDVVWQWAVTKLGNNVWVRLFTTLHSRFAMCILERFERINTSTEQLLDSSAFTAVMKGLVLMCGVVVLFKNFLNSWLSWQLPLDQNRRFRRTYRLYLQGGRNKFSPNRQAVTSSGKWHR